MLDWMSIIYIPFLFQSVTQYSNVNWVNQIVPAATKSHSSHHYQFLWE